MPEKPVNDAPPPSSLRPARVTRPVRRKLAPPEPAPPPVHVPGFEEPLTEIVDTWIERLTEAQRDFSLYDFEIETSAVAGTLHVLDMAFGRADDGKDELVGPFIREFERRRTPEVLTVLEVLGRIAEGRLRSQSAAAAERLQDTGVALPNWFAELEQPCRPVECGELQVLGTPDRMVLLSFQRADEWQGFAVAINDDECGEADAIFAIDPAGMNLGRGFAKVAKQLLPPRTRSTYTELTPDEARWRIETALAYRADHDAELSIDELLGLLTGEENGDQFHLTYPQLLPLVRAKLKLLPQPAKPLPPHLDPDPVPGPHTLNAQIRQFLSQTGGLDGLVDFANFGNSGSGFGDFGDGFGDFGGFGAGPRRRPVLPQSALPKKRTKKDGPPPVYRLRIDLRGAKPPIWRRLEVRADISLRTMHELIQTLFDWQNYHLHVFETEYGPYGTGDADLGHRDPATVSLEQVLRDEGEKLEYGYDFGDNWELFIKLEKVLPPEPGLVPRCTAGRREAPPEDCGGIWAYEEDGPFIFDIFDKDDMTRVLRERFANG